MDQLNELEKFEEIFDLKSMLDSVWKTRPNNNKSSKKETNRNVNKPNANNQDIINDEKLDKDENVKENFDFQNMNEEEKEKNSDNRDNKDNNDFDQGYADNNNDNNDSNPKASGFNKEEDNNRKRIKEEEQKREAEAENQRNVYENDKDIHIDNTKEDKMNVEKDSQKVKEDAFLPEDKEEDLNQDQNDQEMEVEIDSLPVTEKRKLNQIKLEMDKDIDMLDMPEQPQIDEVDKIEWLKKMESDVIEDFNNWIKSDSSAKSADLWNRLESLSIDHINKLIEHLKIALEPNKQTKLRGNYKSGKRLNIKKIISFIASNYRNDKIWLRRTLPFERNYFVTLAIDDSLSMKEHNLGFFALESLVIVSSALNRAGIGKISICGIKEDMEVHHSHTEVFNREKGSYLLSKFKFDFSSRLSHDVAMTNFMRNSMVMLQNQNKQGDASQIVFIISDGRFNKDNVRSLCMEAKEKGLLYVFIILDKYGLENNNSILNMNSVRHVYKQDGEYDIEVKPYLDDFPFSYYVIVEDSADLPEVIHTILVKWFTLNSSQ